MDQLGAEVVQKYIGREPSGRNFNEIALDYKGMLCMVFHFVIYIFFKHNQNFFSKSFQLFLPNYEDVLILLKGVSNMILVKVICNVIVENHFLTLKSILLS